MKIPVLKIDRLMLRPLTVDDAEAVYVWVGDDRVTKYMPYFTYKNLDDVRKWLTNLQSEYETYNFGARDFSANHAVDNPASGKVMEKCGLKFYKFGEYSKFDGSEIFMAKFYKSHLDEII